MRNSEVISCWVNCREGKSKNLSTDGKFLYSYKLLIGFRSKDGLKLLNYRNSNFISHTTSCHVGFASSIATSAELLDPEDPSVPVFDHDCDYCEHIGLFNSDGLASEAFSADLYRCNLKGSSYIIRFGDSPSEYVSYPLCILQSGSEYFSEIKGKYRLAIEECIERDRFFLQGA